MACRRASSGYASVLPGRGLGVVHCPAPKGFTLLLVSSDAHSWIDLIHGKATWSSEKAVVYRPNPGMFPNVVGHITWLKKKDNGVMGIVFSVASQDDNGKMPDAFRCSGIVRKTSGLRIYPWSEALRFGGAMPTDKDPCPKGIKLDP